ncbi:MAG: lamin tail domain-containing protein [Caldilineaceae bacterium]
MINYHLANFDSIEGDRLEYVELYNAGATAVDLSNWHFSDGIEYRFPSGRDRLRASIWRAGSERSTFAFVYNRQPFDTFDKALDNGGETLTLVDAYGRTAVSVTYDDDAVAAEADGDGFTLVLRITSWTGDDVDQWQLSAGVGGSPGRPDPQRVVINEVVAQGVNFGAASSANPGDQPADVSQLHCVRPPGLRRTTRGACAYPPTPSLRPAAT